jgi:hypothetical protein
VQLCAGGLAPREDSLEHSGLPWAKRSAAGEGLSVCQTIAQGLPFRIKKGASSAEKSQCSSHGTCHGYSSIRGLSSVLPVPLKSASYDPVCRAAKGSIAGQVGHASGSRLHALQLRALAKMQDCLEGSGIADWSSPASYESGALVRSRSAAFLFRLIYLAPPRNCEHGSLLMLNYSERLVEHI